MNPNGLDYPSPTRGADRFRVAPSIVDEIDRSSPEP